MTPRYQHIGHLVAFAISTFLLGPNFFVVPTAFFSHSSSSHFFLLAKTLDQLLHGHRDSPNLPPSITHPTLIGEDGALLGHRVNLSPPEKGQLSKYNKEE